MEDKIKKIVAVFLQKEPSDINSATLINRTAIAGSILIHMMYRELTLAGFPVKKYMDINTFGDLLNRINGTDAEQTSTPVQASVPDTVNAPTVINTPIVSIPTTEDTDLEIGIDIENIANFPTARDYREDSFYKANFSSNEISYCILKPKPIESFAGLFCLKEAICKTNENFRNIPFNQIEITHTSGGKPEFKGYALSVSHTKDVATGVAVKGRGTKGDSLVKSGSNDDRVSNIESRVEDILHNNSTSSGNKTGWISIVALLLAIAAIIMEFLCRK